MSQQPPTLQINAPFSWSVQSVAPDDATWSQINDANTHLLHLHFFLDDRRSDAPVEETESLKSEIQRLESKVDYLIDLISNLLRDQIALPPSVDIALSSNTVSWQVRDPVPALGALVKINLYLPPVSTQALQLYVTIKEVTPTVSGNHTIIGEMIFRSEAFRQLLDRTIFRHHRREVARVKQI